MRFLKWTTSVILFSFVFHACGMQHPLQTALHSRSSLSGETSLKQTSVLKEGFSPHSQATEVENTIPDTKSEKIGFAVIAVIAGLVVVAGTVVPLVLLKK